MRSLPCEVRAAIRTRRSSGLSYPVDQTLGDKAIDSDTDGARGQIDDRACRIDRRYRRDRPRPLGFRRTELLLHKGPLPAAYLVRARIAFIITSQIVVRPLNASAHKKPESLRSLHHQLY
jgi:hypothetical protein